MGLVCPHLFIHGSSGVNANISDPIVSNIMRLNDPSGTCKLTITPHPTTIHISLSQSPALNIIADFRNHLTCNLVLLGFGGFSWAVVSLIKNDQETLNKIMAAITGKYDHTYLIKEVNVPMKYSTTIDNNEIKLNSSWGQLSLNAFIKK